MGRGLIKLKQNKKDALKNNNDKKKLKCNRALFSQMAATTATENKNTRVRFVNIGHCAIKFDI